MPRSLRVLLTALLVVLLTACTGNPLLTPEPGAEPPAAESAAQPARARVEGPPSWGAADTLVDRSAFDPTAAPMPRVPVFDVADPAQLREQVRRRCDAHRVARSAAQQAGEAAAQEGASDTLFLRGLAAELQADDIPPGQAAEVLIRGNCGGLGAIVRALVAQGGPAAVGPVADRVRLLMGDEAEGIVIAAATAALGTDLSRPAPRRAADGGLGYAMAYFPLAGVPVEQADSPDALLNGGRDGYGLYTYILGGDTETGSATHRELLRVIETYVLAASPEDSGSEAWAHAFLVPVRPEHSGSALVQRTDPALAAPMRAVLVEHLQARRLDDLARQLAQGPGPFLVTGLKPVLIPADPMAPQLVVDLSAVGPAYMYSVVDAYDRPIPPELAGRAESLAPVRARLLGLFPDPVFEGAAAPAAGTWVHLLGRRPQLARQDAAAITTPASDLPAPRSAPGEAAPASATAPAPVP